jgi:VCBS repeat-containing protein
MTDSLKIVASNDHLSFFENEAFSGNLLANDTAGENGNKFLRFFDGLNVGAKKSGQVTDVPGLYGTFHLKADGTFTYELSEAAKSGLYAGMTLTEKVTYKISDGIGNTDIATLTLDIKGLTTKPVAIDDAFTFSEGDIIVGNVLINDIAGETGKMYLRSVEGTSVEAKTEGQITDVEGVYGVFHFKADGTFTYDLDAGVKADLTTGQAIVEKLEYYKISDGAGHTDVGILELTINGDGEGTSNINPVAANDAFSVSEDGSTIINFAELIANDSDPDGDAVSVTSIDTSAILGSVTVSPSGLTYAPGAAFQYLAEGETASENFTYTISDGQGGSATATATITVNGSNDAPVASDDSAFVTAGTAVIIDVLGNDIDPEGEPLSIQSTSSSANGTVTINLDGTLSYVPNGGYTGEDSFTYTVVDSNGLASTATVSLVVGTSGHVTVGGDVFLQGNFMEIGVSASGSLGSANVAPEGFHSLDASGRISYVVDPDGWDTGILPQAGDFTLPGSPVDTIVLGVNGVSYAQDERSSVRQIDTVTTDTSTGGTLIATTTGAAGGVNFTQKIELDPNATYYTTTITVTNPTDNAINDVVFMRSFDPDQDIYLHGTFQTGNDVLSNPSAGGTNIAVARATGAASGVSVNLVAFDGNARASNYGFANYNAYDPLNYDAPADRNGAIADEAITLTFDVGTLAPGQTVTKIFYTSLNANANANDMTIGTDVNDLLNAGGGDDLLLGLAGDDTLTGGTGNDKFVFSLGSGNDIISDFVAGTNTDDVIELRGFGVAFDSFAEIRAASTQVGTDVFINLGTTTITLQDVNLANISVDDFFII